MFGAGSHFREHIVKPRKPHHSYQGRTETARGASQVFPWPVSGEAKIGADVQKPNVY
jgi:hypothetical protein